MAESKVTTRRLREQSTSEERQSLTGTSAYADMLRTMYLSRFAEERLIRLYHQGSIHGGVFVGIGQEAIGAAATATAERQDLFAPLIRNMSVHVGRGQTLLNIFRQWLSRAAGPTRGRDGNVHHGFPERGVYSMISHLGAMISVVTGAVMARRYQGHDSIGFAFIGDGGTSTGDFHEAANFSAVFDVPVIITIENNRFAYSTPTDRQYRCKQLIDRAVGYGIEGLSVDGNDVMALYETYERIANAIRNDPRPVMLECHTMRMRGHGEHDDYSYIPKELLEEFEKKDPIILAESRFEKDGVMTQEEMDELRTSCRDEIDRAYRQALDEPDPDPDTLLDGVYADG